MRGGSLGFATRLSDLGFRPGFPTWFLTRVSNKVVRRCSWIEIEGKPDEKVAWGSDIAAQMLRRFGIPYISLNPGASYRGLHDSLVNHLGNEQPGILLCLHEDHSVAIAHGYAKATGEPMACVLHSNVGLLHGMMSLFNAWCDRAPMIVLGATGPLDAEKRRPWIDWIHTSRDQGAYIRSIIKWDDQPTSAAGAGGIHVPRQYR